MEHKRKRLREMIRVQRPSLVIGSPCCTAFSQLQRLNQGKGNEADRQKFLEESISHVAFICEIYEEQLKNDRYFLHGHSSTATSWNLDCVKGIMNKNGVQTVVAHMCAFGMTSVGPKGEGPVMKPTRFMTNSPRLAERLERKCDKNH